MSDGLFEATGTPPKVKFPAVTVALSGQDGNIFFIMGRVCGALQRAGATEAEQTEFCEQVMASDSYEAALGVVMRWVRTT